jgi:hypothetical protein
VTALLWALIGAVGIPLAIILAIRNVWRTGERGSKTGEPFKREGREGPTFPPVPPSSL